MNPRLLKEARGLAGVFLLALVAGFLPFIFPKASLWLMGLAALGSFALAASTFGHEFDARTLGSLIAQPIPRARIWAEKHLVLAGALILVWIIPWFIGHARAWDPGVQRLVMIVALAAFCTTPFLTLLAGNALGGIVFSFAIPGTLWWGTWFVLEKRPGLEELTITQVFPLFSWIFAAYALGCLVLGYFSWQSLQVAEMQRAVTLPFAGWFARRRGGGGRFGAGRNPFLNLIAKELRLQQITFLLAMGFCVLQAISLVCFRLFPQSMIEDYFAMPMLLYIWIMPIVCGSVAVAEEKNLGVTEWHLTLPVAAAKQWGIKLLVLFGVVLFLGLMIPLLFIGLSAWIAPSAFRGVDLSWEEQVLLLCFFFLQLFVTLLAAYASSATANTLRAVIFTTGLVILAIMVVAGLSLSREFWSVYGPMADSLSSGRSRTALIVESCATLVASGLCLLGILGVLGFRNFKRIEVRLPRVILQVIGLVLTAGFLWVAMQNSYGTLVDLEWFR